MIDPPLQRGDFVIIGTDTGREVRGMVTLASQNGRAVILMFDAMIGGWAGSMPAFCDEGADEWRGIDNMPITLRRANHDDGDEL